MNEARLFLKKGLVLAGTFWQRACGTDSKIEMLSYCNNSYFAF